MLRILVVANKTLGGSAVLAEVKSRLDNGPCAIHLLVPATPPSGGLTWTEEGAHAEAEHRLAAGLDRFSALGCEVTGEVGDSRPLDAIQDTLRHREVDEIIISTLPVGVSRWLHIDLPRRAAKATHLPVTHVIGAPELVS
jgi:hypothetical protein